MSAGFGAGPVWCGAGLARAGPARPGPAWPGLAWSGGLARPGAGSACPGLVKARGQIRCFVLSRGDEVLSGAGCCGDPMSYHTMSTWLLGLVYTIAAWGACRDLRSWRTVLCGSAVVVVLACGHGVFVRNAASGRAAFCWLVCALAMGKPPRVCPGSLTVRSDQ